MTGKLAKTNRALSRSRSVMIFTIGVMGAGCWFSVTTSAAVEVNQGRGPWTSPTLGADGEGAPSRRPSLASSRRGQHSQTRELLLAANCNIESPMHPVHRVCPARTVPEAGRADQELRGRPVRYYPVAEPMSEPRCVAQPAPRKGSTTFKMILDRIWERHAQGGNHLRPTT